MNSSSQEAPRTVSQSSKRASGHDVVLRALQNKGRAVTVIFCGGQEQIVGTIVAFDPYTVTIRDLGGVRSVIFKHDVRMFTSPEDTTFGPGAAS